jgi:hypothetical protein
VVGEEGWRRNTGNGERGGWIDAERRRYEGSSDG